MPGPKGKPHYTGENRLRIIGGEWRGRKLDFPDHPGLRPTTDRVRETLFNWLAPIIRGARCLDLFAGSGAIGFEALSRGAGKVVMVEKDAHVAAQLRKNLALLKAGHGSVIHTNALEYLQGTPQKFEVAFLDPPFGRDLLLPSCSLLELHGWLTDDARIYLESEKAVLPEELPAGWEMVKDKKAGQVHYYLCCKR